MNNNLYCTVAHNFVNFVLIVVYVPHCCQAMYNNPMAITIIIMACNYSCAHFICADCMAMGYGLK